MVSGELVRCGSTTLPQEPEVPRRCQVAILFPTGSPGDPYKDVEDPHSGIEYHFDGRGQIPNKFTLLVGVALCDQPTEAPVFRQLSFSLSFRQVFLLCCCSHKRNEQKENKSKNKSNRFHASGGSIIATCQQRCAPGAA